MPDVVAARVRIPVTTNASKASRSMRGLNKSIKATDKETSKLSSTIKAAAIGAVLFQAARLAARGLKAATKAASDLEEQTSKFGVTFKGVEAISLKAAKTLQKSFGFSEVAAKEFLSTTGDLVSGLGFSQEASINLSSQLNELAADVTSFKNVSGGTEQTIRAFNSAILGERESLKSLGFSISEAEVKEVLLTKSQEKLTGGALRQAKALATIELITKKNTKAIGDFARTSNSLANRQRVLASALEDTAAAAGKELLGPMSDLTKALSDSASKGGILRTVLTGIAKIAGVVVRVVANLVTFLNDATSEIKQIEKEEGFTVLASQVKATEAAIRDYTNTLRANDSTARQDKEAHLGLAAAKIRLAKETRLLADATIRSNNSKLRSGIALDSVTKATKKNKQAEIDLKKAIEGTTGARVKAAIVEEELENLFNLSFKEKLKSLKSYFAAGRLIADKSHAERIAMLQERFLKMTQVTGISNEALLAIQKVFNEESVSLEMQRFKRIADITQQVVTQAQLVGNIFSSLAAVRRNLMQQEINDAEASSDAQIAAMEAAGATQEEIDNARAASEARLAAKRRKLAKKAARDQKLFGTYSVILDTSIAVTKALATLPPPSSFVVAGLTATAGAAQLAAINTAPTPAQFGGSFMVNPGNEADSGLLAVNSGERVDVTPVGDTDSSGGGGLNSGAVNLMVDGASFKGFITDTVQAGFDSGLLTIGREGSIRIN